MINDFVRNLIYFILFVSIQVLFLNHIHFLRMATPFLYVYFFLKLPYGMSRSQMLFLSFITGLAIDAFTNTPGMHAAACTLAGFVREPLIRFLIGKDMPEGLYPSFRTFGYGSFFRYTFLIVAIHHLILFGIESLSLFDPLSLALRILGSMAVTILLVFAAEAFNLESQRSGEKQ
ncbi:MAG: rod shape-determining protein MreD [Tannerellaceae bacterium]|jgi:rod shape-determining protein MreD|nr:rod shape-determining protein MreD [Tannerellaceae bacterium]